MTTQSGPLYEDPLQAILDEFNRESPPDHTPMPLLGIFRHNCPSKRNTSQPIQLNELYITSPACPDLALLAREGKCKRCGQTCRSTTGRIVDRELRPPITGRVGRG